VKSLVRFFIPVGVLEWYGRQKRGLNSTSFINVQAEIPVASLNSLSPGLDSSKISIISQIYEQHEWALPLVMQKTPETQQTRCSQQYRLLRTGKKSTEVGDLSG
jgi:hypothetical protein